METPQTNADRIRAMTDEELADWEDMYVKCADCWIADLCDDYGYKRCRESFMSWLRAPVESEGKP